MSILISAQAIVSVETMEARKNIVELLERHLAPMTEKRKVERVEGDDPEDVRAKLAVAPPGSLVDLEAKNVPDEEMRHMVRGLHLRQVSNAFKHLAALRRIAVAPSGGARFSLVVEDDALFGDNMVEAVRRAAEDAPADADVVFLGLPSTRKPPGPGEPSSFDDPMKLFGGQVIPACESYLITPAAAAKLSAAYLPVRFATNAQLTFLFRAGVAKPYVAVPNAFVDGSKVGVMTSSLNTNNQLLWNNPYCRADAAVRRRPYGAEDAKQFEAAWSEQMFKEHPDAVVVRADHLAASGKPSEAATEYAKALETYGKMGCVVNNTSEWLRRYMNLHGKLQSDIDGIVL